MFKVEWKRKQTQIKVVGLVCNEATEITEVKASLRQTLAIHFIGRGILSVTECVCSDAGNLQRSSLLNLFQTYDTANSHCQIKNK